MKHLLKILMAVTIFSSCNGSADDKVPELAGQMCNCFDGFQQSLTDGEKKLMKDVALSENPQNAMRTGIAAFTPEAAKAFVEKFTAIGNQNSPIAKCMEEMDKKNNAETTKDKKALIQKILAEMKKNGNCYVGAAIINLNPTAAK